MNFLVLAGLVAAYFLYEKSKIPAAGSGSGSPGSGSGSPGGGAQTSGGKKNVISKGVVQIAQKQAADGDTSAANSLLNYTESFLLPEDRAALQNAPAPIVAVNPDQIALLNSADTDVQNSAAYAAANAAMEGNVYNAKMSAAGVTPEMLSVFLAWSQIRNNPAYMFKNPTDPFWTSVGGYDIYEVAASNGWTTEQVQAMNNYSLVMRAGGLL